MQVRCWRGLRGIILFFYDNCIKASYIFQNIFGVGVPLSTIRAALGWCSTPTSLHTEISLLTINSKIETQIP